jgi:putative transferase (TIGR04331 family)
MAAKNKILGFHGLLFTSRNRQLPWVIDQKQHHLGMGYLLKLADKILINLANELNELHQCEKSVRYWHLLLGSWLMQFLAVLYDRFSLLEQLSQESSQFHLELSVKSKITPRNTYEALKLAETEHFNNQIVRDILENIDFFDFKIVQTENELCFATTPNFGGNNGFKKKILNSLSRLFMSKSSFVASIGTFPLRVQSKLIPKFKRLRPIYPYIDGVENYNHTIDSNKRSELSLSCMSEDQFENLFYRLLPKYIPVCFVEGFSKLTSLSKRYGSYPQAVLVGTEVYYRYESFMNWVAESGENGTTLLSMQHGGVYGTEFRCEKTFIEVNPFDTFYTWGWEWDQLSRSKNSRVKAMPSLFLVDQIRRGLVRDPTGKILLLTTSKNQSPRRFDGAVNFTYSNEQYFTAQTVFYACLEDSIRSNTMVRLYKDDLRNNYKSRWEQKFVDVKFDTDPSFESSLSNTRLLIVDHISTTWLEAVASNIPFILYVEGDVYDFVPEFYELLQSLKRVSIFFETAQAAAEAVNLVCRDIDSWWWSTEVQNVLRRARQLMAFSPENMEEIWLEELKKK